MGRQVRIEGTTERTSREDSEAYFQSRPRGSRLGAAASPQSEVIPTRATLDRRLAELETEFEGKEVPCPPQWGGIRLIPDQFEFWQEGPNRLHDRIRYRRGEGRAWIVERLAP